jgi:murein DD-endopeptidase MepM/ murein hydrolase activator NlpD
VDPLIAPLLLIAGGALVLARKPFRLHPVDARVSSRYGSRVDPIDGTPGTFHNGVDYAAPAGSRAVSIGEGRVSRIFSDDRSGLALVFEGVGAAAGWSWSYAHLSDVWVAEGASVAEGEHVADTGNSGRSTGPHLHFTVRKRGALVDPLSVLP